MSLVSSSLLRLPRHCRRSFATTSHLSAGCTGPVTSRAIVYAEHGDPQVVLRGHTYTLRALEKGEVRVRFELAAFNPADVNVIQGVYPVKPAVRTDIGEEPLTIMGNEGTGIVEGLEEDGNVETLFKVGDRVIMGQSQRGTWQTHHNLPAVSLLPLTSNPPLTAVQASTLSINPPTALRMLSDFVHLHPSHPQSKTVAGGKKQWVIQNGGNSAVGVAVIQLAREWGVGTISLVRNRDDIDELTASLKALGADHVFTYSEFLSRESGVKNLIKASIADGELRLALNCVGGKETGEMAKLLGHDGFLVTYGGMAKVPLALPPSLFIFKNLSATGFWLSNWIKNHPSERGPMMNEIAQLVADGKLKEPETEIIELSGDDASVGSIAREVMRANAEGRGKKVLFKFV